MARAYIPSTVEELGLWFADRSVPLTELAVVIDETEPDEELEYDALMTAAAASAELLVRPGRRVVVVADVPSPGDASAGRIAWRDLAAVHADPQARPVGADPDEDLAWFGIQEVPSLFG